MNVEVHYTTQLRSALGRTHQRVELEPGATLDRLLERLAGEHAEVFTKLVVGTDGRLLPNIILCVDDQQVVRPESHVLTDGASVTILSAISGG